MSVSFYYYSKQIHLRLTLMWARTFTFFSDLKIVLLYVNIRKLPESCSVFMSIVSAELSVLGQFFSLSQGLLL
jgi:hypothetical protein